MSFFEYLAENLNYLLIVIFCLLIVLLSCITASVLVRLYDLKKGKNPPIDTDIKEKSRKE